MGPAKWSCTFHIYSSAKSKFITSSCVRGQWRVNMDVPVRQFSLLLRITPSTLPYRLIGCFQVYLRFSASCDLQVLWTRPSCSTVEWSAGFIADRDAHHTSCNICFILFDSDNVRSWRPLDEQDSTRAA